MQLIHAVQPIVSLSIRSVSLRAVLVVLLRFALCVLPLGHTRPSVVSGFHRARSMAEGVGTFGPAAACNVYVWLGPDEV